MATGRRSGDPGPSTRRGAGATPELSLRRSVLHRQVAGRLHDVDGVGVDVVDVVKAAGDLAV